MTAATNVRLDVERCASAEPPECPTDGCGRPLRASRAMCRDCWARVPTDLKRDVRSAARGSWERWVDAMCAAVHAAEVAPA
jgi:hypothetical protein